MTTDELHAVLLGLCVGCVVVLGLVAVVWVHDRRRERKDARLVAESLPDSSAEWEARR